VHSSARTSLHRESQRRWCLGDTLKQQCVALWRPASVNHLWDRDGLLANQLSPYFNVKHGLVLAKS
jgi:hypothetical protein